MKRKLTGCQQGAGATALRGGNFDLLDGGQGLAGNCEGSVQTNLPFVIRVREVDKTTHIGPFTRHCSYNGVGPGGTGKSVGKGFFDNTGGLTAVTI